MLAGASQVWVTLTVVDHPGDVAAYSRGGPSARDRVVCEKVTADYQDMNLAKQPTGRSRCATST